MATPEHVFVKTEMEFDFDIQNYQQESSQSSTNETSPFCGSHKSRQNSEKSSTNFPQQQLPVLSHEPINSGDVKLQKLLKEFDLEILHSTLKLADITYRSLKYLTAEEINAAIRHLGYRAEFREKLFAWRRGTSEPNGDTTRTSLQLATNARLPITALHKPPTQTPQIATTAPMPKPGVTFLNSIHTATPTAAAAPMPIMTPVKRALPDLGGPEDFLSMMPGVTGTATRINNTPTVVLEHTVDLEQALNFMPTTKQKPPLADNSGLPAELPCTSSAAGAAAATTTPNLLKPMTAGGHLPKGHLAMSCLKVHVNNLLESTLIGRTIKQLYNKNGFLDNQQRNEIVRLIIEQIMQQGESLSPKEFRTILNDIIRIFPNERAAADYYFIYRSGKGNPLGRLYQRYSNENSKRRKLTRLAEDYDGSDGERQSNLLDDEDTMSAYPQELPGNVPRIDEMTALALKQLLTTEHFSWEEVCDKWIQTWALRQKELQQSGLAELLSSWSKLSDPRAAELFKIDFRYVYPEKESMLFSKWDEYVKRIAPQFDRKINYENIKKLYKYCKIGMASKDEQDFVYAIGLTVLLPTSGRFKDHTGKLKIRANVADSIDSFVMRLTSLEAYESQLALYTRKFGAINRSTHPFLVVVSPNDYKISKIYVALENRFYCMQSFLQALDLCYKIYHTCGLKYPVICENVWTFIQRYFYDMTVPWEARNANLVALIVSLNVQS